MRNYRAYYSDGLYLDFTARSWLGALNHALEQTSGTTVSLTSLERLP